MKKAHDIYIRHWLSLFAIVAFGSCCGSSDSNDINSDQTNISEYMSPSEPFLSPVEYAILAKKATKGDAVAAFALYNNFTYGHRDYGLAYFWAIKAKEYGHPDVTEKTIRNAEKTILGVAADPLVDKKYIDIADILPETPDESK